ncbi:MAG: biotin/lipoyl-binding protein [Bacteroidota bacterium]
MKKLIYILVIMVPVLTSCNKNKNIEGLQGKVKRDVISIASKYPGRIEKCYIQEGNTVKKGDTLAILEVPEIEAKRRQALGAVQSAKAQYEMALKGATNNQLEQVSAKLDAVTEQYKFAEKSYKRINAMHKDSLVSDQKHDEVYMKYKAAKAQLEGVNAKYHEVKSGVRDEKIKMALGTYERAKGALEEANIAYAERYITAPQNMTIETIALKEGELALPGYGLFTGYKINGVYFRFTVSESSVAKYKPGSVYTVISPFTDSSIKAKLINIKQLTHYADITSAFPEYQLGESTYELKLVPDNEEDLSSVYTNLTVLLPNN